mmetsp:Transcript_47741/g.88926  ORF Transcript_47741/g.88926 Transcript_47741/m.88926 type:complete len:820 (+) Transcript_47741:9-2468(+)
MRALALIKPFAVLSTRRNFRRLSPVMASVPTADPHAWLEDVLGEKQLEWAKGRNEECIATVGDPSKLETYKRILAIYDSKDKIPGLRRIGNDGFYYNFWKDENHVQGIWRKTTLASYRSDTPEWTTVIDVDALPPPTTGTASTWVWHGTSLLDEGPQGLWDRCLVFLSPGGSDADTTREFDLKLQQWVEPSEGGFALPEAAKARVGYRTRDEVLIGTDFHGDGATLTDSGYPRVVKVWKRGTPLSEAVTVFEGLQTDISADQYAYHDRGFCHEFQRRSVTFYTSKHWYRIPSDGLGLVKGSTAVGASGDPSNAFAPVPVPDDASLSTFADQATIELRSDWAVEAVGKDGSKTTVTYVAGTLLACPMAGVMAGDFSEATVLFEPSATASLQSSSGTKNFLVLKVLDDVKAKLVVWRYQGEGKWATSNATSSSATEESGAAAAAGGGGGGSDEGVTVGEDVVVSAVWPDDTDELWLYRDGYLVPLTLELATLAAPEAKADSEAAFSMEVSSLKAMPAMFESEGLVVEQNFAVSKDGTKIPYFVMRRRDLVFDSLNPTLVDAYGGFEISLTPGYSGGVGVGWLERGGVKVVANIRGGGEYGPKWHQAALKENRFKAYEDVEAVAADLIARNITSPPKLAVIGGSNGGLMVGNMLTRPVASSLFGAAVCQVPLLDMKRFSHLLAGASWMAEFGDPDIPQEWSSLRRHSPYQLLRHDCLGLPEEDGDGDHVGQWKESWTCPKVLFTTSTRDDRVHPAHARKMVKALLDEAKPLGKAPQVLYWENVEGGHGGAADNKQRAYMWALSFEFLAQSLGLVPPPPAADL